MLFNIQPFNKQHLFSLFSIVITTVLLWSCESTPERPGFPEMDSQTESSPVLNTGNQTEITTETIPVENPIIPPAPQISFQKGVLINSVHSDFVQEVINQSSPNPIQHIIFADSSMQAVDLMLYQPEWMERVQQAARTAQSQSVKTYLWSREINLEGTSFVFADDTPLVVARQTAYRNVLRRVPELSGIVLSLDDALLPPWNASSVMQSGSMNAAQKALFVINMIQQVVVSEFSKDLMVYVPASMPDSIYITDALKAISNDKIQIITTSSEIAAMSPINGNMKVHWLADAGSNDNGLITALPDELVNSMSKMNPDLHGGMTISIGNNMKPLWDTVNGVNWHIFHSWTPGIALHETAWDDWIQQILSTLPVSDEGRLLRGILQEGTQYSKSVSVFSIDNKHLTDSKAAEILQNLLNPYSQPNQQILTDLAQENFEKNVWCASSKQNIERLLQNRMRPKIYQDLLSRLEIMQQITALRHYIQQCALGFQVWKATRSETEALYLESHLLSLENILQNSSHPIASTPLKNQLSQLVTQIRSGFPQVLVGSIPRNWNKITGIRIQQVNTNEVILYWQTDFPSRARVMISGENSAFNRIVEGENREVIYHQAVLSGLQPSEQYTARIQCFMADGNITHSGTIPVLINSLSL